MAKTWEQLRSEMAATLDDPNFQTYKPSALLAGMNDALVAFAGTHTPKLSLVEYTGDGETVEFSLPDNLVTGDDMGIYGILWTDGSTWLRERMPSPGGTSSSQRTYFVWLDKIKFHSAPDDGSTVKMYYAAYYPELENESSVVDVPRWALEAIKMYTMSQVLTPLAVKRGRLAVYQDRSQSGNPEHNSIVKMMDHMMKRYYDILSSHKKLQVDLVE